MSNWCRSTYGDYSGLFSLRRVGQYGFVNARGATELLTPQWSTFYSSSYAIVKK